MRRGGRPQWKAAREGGGPFFACIYAYPSNNRLARDAHPASKVNPKKTCSSLLILNRPTSNQKSVGCSRSCAAKNLALSAHWIIERAALQG